MAKKTESGKVLTAKDRDALLSTLQARFEKNAKRHPGLTWAKVLPRLEANAQKLWSLNEMEKSGGEPDVTAHDEKSGEVVFTDCAPESPSGRRSFCYDGEALAARKENKPKDSALHAAEVMGIEVLDEAQYAQLQSLGAFDLKTSSWLRTPESVRKLGGALFGDRRFERVFTYHNGAESYYAARGFRGALRV